MREMVSAASAAELQPGLQRRGGDARGDAITPVTESVLAVQFPPAGLTSTPTDRRCTEARRVRAHTGHSGQSVGQSRPRRPDIRLALVVACLIDLFTCRSVAHPKDPRPVRETALHTIGD